MSLPRPTACILWTRPAPGRLIRLRNQLVTATLGRQGLMKCAEIVTTFLRNAATEDPWGALITNTVMTSRRLIEKDACRKAFSFDELARLATRGDSVNNKKTSSTKPSSRISWCCRRRRNVFRGQLPAEAVDNEASGGPMYGHTASL